MVLSRQFKFALALLTAVAASGAVCASAGVTTTTSTTTTTLPCGYPFLSTDGRTGVSFNESDVLRAFSPQGNVTATPGLTIKVWYNDEHALTLGVRQVVVKSRTGTTTTDYPFSSLPKNPGSVLYPQVGTTALDGDQAGTDSSSCAGYPDRCDRPMFPAMFLTDITTNPNSRVGDWQGGGMPLAPHAIFGTWKGAVRYVDKTKTPAYVTVTPDADPAKNSWNLGSGDVAPAGLKNEGYGAEVRWNVDDLVAAGRMIYGHTYRMQFMVHDGDQNKAGGDSGEFCVNVKVACGSASTCNDGDACTTDTCDAGVCHNTAIAGCKKCTANTDCNDGNACTTESCVAGACSSTTIAGCKPCVGPADCDDQNPCTMESCDAGVCHDAPIPGCKLCTTPSDCDDGNLCTYDTCDGGVCGNTPIDRCKTCTTSVDCNDGNVCSYDSCDGGVCSNTMVEGCKPCAVASDCNDSNACTTESCVGGICYNTPINRCKPCSTAGECNDGNACTTDTCEAGVCKNTAATGCKPCTLSSQCNDYNAATTDTCVNGVCTYTAATTARETTPTEICGNCIDDDGNGLTDFEDPACAGQTGTLTLENGRLRPSGNATRMDLHALLAGVTMNADADDVTLQIRPENGTDVFCARIPAASLVKHPRLIKFADPRHQIGSAGHLDGLKIHLPASGAVRLLAAAKRAQMTCPDATGAPSATDS